MVNILQWYIRSCQYLHMQCGSMSFWETNILLFYMIIKTEISGKVLLLRQYHMGHFLPHLAFQPLIKMLLSIQQMTDMKSSM